MKLLLVGAPNEVFHDRRHIEVLTRAGVEVHLIDRAYHFRPTGLPLGSHAPWPKSGRLTLRKLLGRSLGDRLADWVLHRQLRAIWRRTGAQACHVLWIDERPWHCGRAGLRPLVVTAYGSDLNWTQIEGHDADLLAKKAQAIAECDLLVADSGDMIEIGAKIAGRAPPSMLLPIGIDTTRFRPGYEHEAAGRRAALGIPQDAIVVFSPRAMSANYRHEAIAEAFCAAVRQTGTHAYILFKSFNSDGVSEDRVLDVARAHGLEDRVRMLDETPYAELPVLYAMSDLVVNFPILDAFPVTFLEAFATEVPVLTNRLPAYACNGAEGFLAFTADDGAGALARDLAAFLQGRAASGDLAAAREHVVRNFDELAFGASLRTAYEALVAKGQP